MNGHWNLLDCVASHVSILAIIVFRVPTLHRGRSRLGLRAVSSIGSPLLG